MRLRYLFFSILGCLTLAACKPTNNGSKIPHISLITFSPDSMRVNVDTTYIEFNLTDGDGDIGNDTVSQIYLKDSRFDSLGFTKTPFPIIDGTIEDPRYGLQGKCLFYPVPQPTPRFDSLHTATGDTLFYELYITDRAGHESNHIITHSLIIRP